MSGREELSRLVARGRGWLQGAARNALAGGVHVANEGDRWFVAAVRELAKGADKAERGVDSAAEAVVARLAPLRPRWMQRLTPRQRIEQLLRDEAKRLDFDVTQQQFLAFSAKIATLLELVYTGTVRLDDIAFEHADVAVASEPKPKPEPEPEPNPDPSAAVASDAVAPAAVAPEPPSSGRGAGPA
jgi:hypothetical protein